MFCSALSWTASKVRKLEYAAKIVGNMQQQVQQQVSKPTLAAGCVTSISRKIALPSFVNTIPAKADR